MPHVHTRLDERVSMATIHSDRAELRADSMPWAEAGPTALWGDPIMKMRLVLAGGLLLALSGCATYDYVGGGGGGNGYYHGAPSVEYRYPAGYPYGYGSGYYGGGGYYGYGGGYGGGYGYPVYRPYPNYRPPHNHRPPPRPGNGNPTRPPDRPRPNNGGSPWRNMDSLGGPRRPQQQQQQRPSPPPQARPAQAPRPAAPRMNGSPWRNLNNANQRTVEP